MGRKRTSIGAFLRNLENIENGNYEYVSNYSKMSEKVTLKHIICNNTFDVVAANFINNATRCPYCCRKNIKYTIDEIQQIIGDDYKVVKAYKDEKVKHLVRCKKCKKEFYIHQNRFEKYLNNHMCSLEEK